MVIVLSNPHLVSFTNSSGNCYFSVDCKKMRVEIAVLQVYYDVDGLHAFSSHVLIFHAVLVSCNVEATIF